MRILAISGSLRARSSNTALLEAAGALLPPGVEVELYRELAILPPFNPDLDGEGHPPPPAVARLRERVRACDGLVICSPEYAHGIPGVLKNALDWLVSFPDFEGKRVLLLNASAAGGMHAQAQLAEVLRTMSARVLPESLTAPFLPKRLDTAADLPPAAAEALRAGLLALTRE
jgi:NAD(P)H-dependent FMN reductase